MIRRGLQLALGGMLLGCSGCVVAPYPYAAGPQGPPCRTVTQPITVDGKDVPGYGIQCLQPDGSWQLMGALSPTPPVAPPQPDPGVAYPQPYPYYPYAAYPYAYPWIYGPDIVIGGGWGWGGGGGGGWHGGGGGGGWQGGGGDGGGGGWHGGGGGGGQGGGGGGGHGGR